MYTVFFFLCAGRPISHVSAGGSSNRSSVSDERGQPPIDDSFEVDRDDVVLKQTTAVVKTVMELSNKVPISRPSDYVDLVRVRERERERERVSEWVSEYEIESEREYESWSVYYVT